MAGIAAKAEAQVGGHAEMLAGHHQDTFPYPQPLGQLRGLPVSAAAYPGDGTSCRWDVVKQVRVATHPIPNQGIVFLQDEACALAEAEGPVGGRGEQCTN